MTKHKHAELMALYAQDAMETDKPWERWEVRHHDKWCGLTVHPNWHAPYDYRRKLKTLSVTLESGEVVSWPAPHRTELEYRDNYYFVDADGSVIGEVWDGVEWDKLTLADGWVHLTEDAAKQHAAALRKINTQGFNHG